MLCLLEYVCSMYYIMFHVFLVSIFLKCSKCVCFSFVSGWLRTLFRTATHHETHGPIIVFHATIIFTRKYRFSVAKSTPKPTIDATPEPSIKPTNKPTPLTTSPPSQSPVFTTLSPTPNPPKEPTNSPTLRPTNPQTNKPTPGNVIHTYSPVKQVVHTFSPVSYRRDEWSDGENLST